MDVSCPRCSASVVIDQDDRDDSGRVRLRCGECNAKLLIKINAPSLKVDNRIQPTTSEHLKAIQQPVGASTTGRIETLDDIDIDTGSVDVEKAGDSNGAGSWVVIVQDLPMLEVGELRRIMLRIPRFSRHPNKLQDLTTDLPFILPGIHQEEAVSLGDSVLGMGGTCISGPASDLLDDNNQLKSSEPDDDSGDDDDGLDDEAVFVIEEEDEDEDGSLDDDIYVQDEDEAAGEEGGAEPGFEPIAFDDLVAPADAPQASSRQGSAGRGVVLTTASSVADPSAVLGLVSASAVVSGADLGGKSRNTMVAAAVSEAQGRLEAEALALGASSVVGVQTSLGSLADGGVLVVLTGTGLV